VKYVIINADNQPIAVTDDPISLYTAGKIQSTDRLYQLGNEVRIETKLATLPNKRTRQSVDSDCWENRFDLC
jgi:hypothetical protein